MNEVRIEPLGEDALLLRFDQRIDAASNARVHAIAAVIERARPHWLRELVPAYASLALQVDADDADDDPLQRARDWLTSLLSSLPSAEDGDALSAATDASPPLDVPVCYGGEHGPDLADVAAASGLAIDEVVRRHGAGVYTVAMLGFAPGFPYLLGLDPALATPRLETPRTRVAAGSVGIGGAQTGIYPREGPGGWRIVGRTPLSLFDAVRTPPCLLAPGQRLRFVAIDAGEFARLARRQRAGSR